MRKLIVEADVNDFRRKVGNAEDDGWQVITGTVTGVMTRVAVAIGPHGPAEKWTSSNGKGFFSCIMEKEG